MVALTASQRYALQPGLIAAAIVGFVAGVAALLLPGWRVEALVSESGLPALLPAAAPPLGTTARLALALFAAALAGGATYAAAQRFLPKQPLVRTAARRADAHPDAPLREPVKAMRELGTPFLEAGTNDVPPEPEEQDLPNDLDQPLAAFDPSAIPSVPMTPSAPVMPLFRKPAPAAEPVTETESSRIEIFEFTPIVRSVPVAEPEAEPVPRIAGLRTEATIHALLDRLDQGVRRVGRPRVIDRAHRRELDEALATLRQFAEAR